MFDKRKFGSSQHICSSLKASSKALIIPQTTIEFLALTAAYAMEGSERTSVVNCNLLATVANYV